MRWLLALLAYAFVPSLEAQGFISGLVTDEADGSGLPCIEVWVLDSAGTMRARTHTFAEGIFQVPAPPIRTFQLRFFTWGMVPVSTPLDSLDPTHDHEAHYRLQIDPLAPPESLPKLPSGFTAAYIGPGVLQAYLRPLFPNELRSRLESGTAVVRYVVDTSGVAREGSIVRVSASHPAFFSSARDFLRAARFSTAREDDVPICAMAVQIFLFQAR